MARAVIAVTTFVVLVPGAEAATPGARLWIARTASYASFQAVAASPDATKVFVAGTGSSGYVTIAYDSGTGAVVWSKTLGSNPDGGFTQLTVSPDGTKIFVSGISTGATTDWDFGTIAYDASTGDKLWFRRYDGASGPDWPSQVAISPDGSTVVVAGSVATGPDPDHSDFYTDYGTVAYDASTGAKLWSRIYDPLGDIGGSASDAVITADGKAIVTGVTTRSTTSGGNTDAVTIAYDLVTGQKVWLTRSDDSAADVANALALSPDGRSAFAVGYTMVNSRYPFATWAYRTATGTQRWLSTYGGSISSVGATDAAVVADGTVFVTGTSVRATTGEDFLTIAYEPTAGLKLWSKRYDGPTSDTDIAFGIAVNPAGSAVYVTGSTRSTATSDDWATISYDPSTGAGRWTKRFSGSANVYDRPASIAASPDGTAVFVTGSANSPNDQRGLTIAYAS